MSVPIRGLPEHTYGVDFVPLRDRGLLAVGPDGRVWMIVKRPGCWVLLRVDVARGQLVVWTSYTRRGAVGALLLVYVPLG